MSEPDPPKKFWYQDGWVIFWILFVGFLVWVNVRPSLESAYVRVVGRVHQPFFGNSHFELNVSHQFPGDLKQGSLAVRVKGKAVPTGEQFRKHSFEIWSPNEVHALSFQFPLEDFRPDSILSVECLVQATNAKTTSSRFVWQKDRWIH